MKTWAKVLLWVIVLGLVGGGTYYKVNAKAKQDKNNLQAQIDDLNTKLTAAQKSLADAQANAKSANEAATRLTAAATATANANAWKSYSNTTYGFSMTFPNDTWKNYTVKQVTPTDKSAIKFLYFCLPTTDKTWVDSCDTGYVGPISIAVYTKAQWADVANSDTPDSASKIAENTNYVFGYGHFQDAPSDYISKDLGLSALQASIKAN